MDKDTTHTTHKADYAKDPMVQYVVEQFARYEKHWKDKFDEAQQIYDYWQNKPPIRDYTWQNAVHVPMTLEAEQTISPRLFAALFPNEAPVEVMVEGEGDPLQGTVIKDGIKHYFKLAGVESEGSVMVSQCTLLGTAYGEEGWITERQWLEDKTTGERYEAIVSNRPTFKCVDYFEMFPHPAKKCIGDGLPLIRRRFCDAEYLKKLVNNPNFEMTNLDEALQSESEVRESAESQNTSAVDRKDYNPTKKEEYEILEYWGPWDASYKKEDKVVKKEAQPHWIIVINRKVKVRGMANPHNFQHEPFVKIKLMEDPKPSWHGVGVGKAGMPTQERLNKIVNQRLDNVDLVLNKQGCFNGSDTLINIKKLMVSKPGQWHKVSDTVSSLRWMDIPDVTASSYREEEIAKTDFRESTGATNPLMPADEGQHRTAMGINLLQGAAGMRFKPVLRRMEVDFIQALAEMFLSDLQQFMTFPEWIKMTSNEGKSFPVQLTPEMIQGKVQFIPTGVSEAVNRELQVGQLLRFKELTMDDPTVNRREINKRIAELMGFKDLDKILTPATQVEQGGEMSPEDQEFVNQRQAEGATEEEIMEELMGDKMRKEQQRGPKPGNDPGGGRPGESTPMMMGSQ